MVKVEKRQDLEELDLNLSLYACLSVARKLGIWSKYMGTNGTTDRSVELELGLEPYGNDAVHSTSYCWARTETRIFLQIQKKCTVYPWNTDRKVTKTL